MMLARCMYVDLEEVGWRGVDVSQNSRLDEQLPNIL